jgi:hypothetical protein
MNSKSPPAVALPSNFPHSKKIKLSTIISKRTQSPAEQAFTDSLRISL